MSVYIRPLRHSVRSAPAPAGNNLIYRARAKRVKGVKQSKGQEESQEEKKLEARNGEYNTPVGYSKVLEDPQED